MNDNEFATRFEVIRGELESYLLRLLAIPALAEDLVQTAALHALRSARSAPLPEREFRAWMFRIATNLAIDELRRAARWRNDVMVRLRESAEGAPQFVAFSGSLRGDPEMHAIAREHLTVCFSCTSRNLEPERAAALLLREVFGFSLDESAAMLDVRPVLVKNWLQEARRSMASIYGETCALVAKRGVCHQCTELDGFFNGGNANPLTGQPNAEEGRLALLRELAGSKLGRWHRELLRFIDGS